jgi:hypothetical protein
VKVNANLYLARPSFATIYYVLRKHDKSGSGWVRISMNSLAKDAGRLSVSSVYRLLAAMRKERWLHTYELGGKSGVIYVKYAADRTITRDVLSIARKPIYILAAYKDLRDKALMRAKCYLGQMNFAQKLVENKLQYSIGKRKIAGELVPLSTLKKENRQLRRVAKVRVNDSMATSSSSTNNPIPAHISFSIKGQKGVKVLNLMKYKVASISTQTLAKQLGKNRRTIDRYLRTYFSKERIKLYKRVSLTEANEAPFVLWDIDEDNFICDAYRPIPFIYVRNVLYKDNKDLFKKPLISYLNDKQLEVAKLCAITKGFSNDNEGAEQYLRVIGLERFKKNTNSISDSPRIYNPHFLYKGKFKGTPEKVVL